MKRVLEVSNYLVSVLYCISEKLSFFLMVFRAFESHGVYNNDKKELDVSSPHVSVINFYQLNFNFNSQTNARLKESITTKTLQNVRFVR